MRRFIFLALLAAMATSAEAARPVTVRQLLQLLETKHAARNGDTSIANLVESLELSERLTRPTLDRIKLKLEPGVRTAQALDLLADASLFLEPPAGEVPVKDPPNTVTRQVMLNGAASFAAVTLRQLPNLQATRETRSFSSNPEKLNVRAPRRLDMSLASISREQVSYRNGLETPGFVRASSAKANQAPSTSGLASQGEFGPLLALVLLDAARSGVKWSRWEETPSGLAAVFEYQVPQAVSHYRVVILCCAIRTRLGLSREPYFYDGTPAYHGKLYLDPATGAVLRFTVEPEFKKSDPVERVAQSVEYGKAEIGDKSYDCPVQSIALIAIRNLNAKAPEDRTFRSLNAVSFIDYRRPDSTENTLASAPAP